MDKNGLNANELRTFNDLLIKANNLQLEYLRKELYAEILKREQTQNIIIIKEWSE